MATASDVIGAILVGSLFFGIVTFWFMGQRTLENKLNQQAENLKSKGVEVSQSGMKIQTHLDLNQEDLIQKASHQAQVIKTRLNQTPNIARFGQKSAF